MLLHIEIFVRRYSEFFGEQTVKRRNARKPAFHDKIYKRFLRICFFKFEEFPCPHHVYVVGYAVMEKVVEQPREMRRRIGKMRGYAVKRNIFGVMQFDVVENFANEVDIA